MNTHHIDRNDALEFLKEKLTSINLRKHCYAAEAAMKGVYTHLHKKNFSQKQCDLWGIAGLVHDIDYEFTKDDPKSSHSKVAVEWLSQKNYPQDVINAVSRHAWGYLKDAPKPQTPIDWALYCSDELTGFIIAVALVHPEKKLNSVTVEKVLKKWNQKAFAAAVNRKQIENCETKLNIKLEDFIQIVLRSMQEIDKELGL